MNRRDVLTGIGRLTTLGGLTSAGAALTSTVAFARTDSLGAFASSFKNVPAIMGPSRIRFDQPLPRGLAGTLYRNGPARMSRGDTRYRHWFDGDGMIQSFKISGQEMVHQGRVIATERSQAEAAAGRFLWPGFGTTFDDARSVRSPDDVNVANISVLPLGDELLALWEAGSAWKIDPDTLATLGKKTFSADTIGLPFSAHPRVDPNGTVWNFGYMSGSGKLVLYELARGGSLKRVQLIDAPNAEMVHDFAITERYLVFVLMPIRFERNRGRAGAAFLDRLNWDPSGHVDVLLVDKSTLTVARRFELPPFFAFHLGNAWEDGETIRIEVARAPGFDSLMQAISQATLGLPVQPLARPHAMQIELNMRVGSARTVNLPVAGADFPRFDQRFTGQKTSQLFMMADADGQASGQPDRTFGFNQLLAIDTASESVQRWTYDKSLIAEEHLFVPDAGKPEGTGWLLGTVYDAENHSSSLNVFDARAVAAGPIASARLPYHLPLGLHGQFVAA